MTNLRAKFLASLCETCIQPSGQIGCGHTFRSILEPIHCPRELSTTHEVCSFCLDVYQQSRSHSESCVFAKRGLKLHAGGWATPASSKVLRSIRRSAFPYREPLINLIHALLIELGAENAVIVPIPMSCAGRSNRWLQVMRDASQSLNQVQIQPVIKRDKQESTRRNLAQTRIRIATQEYTIDEEVNDSLRGKRIILVDDNVTTGVTLTHCADMLRELNPTSIQMLVVDRTVSARVLQRCPTPTALECRYHVPRSGNSC
jgi:predicted amidophosphoribosyltransferase